MTINTKSAEYSISFRNWNYAKSLYYSSWKHIISYCWGKWLNSNTCNIWKDSGFRILGIEFNKRVWLH